MRLKHDEHWSNIIVYGDCECGSGRTIQSLVNEVEKSKLKKLLENYPDIRLGKFCDEITASTPY